MHDHADWILSDNYLKHQKPNRHEDNQFLKRGTSTHTTTTKLAAADRRLAVAQTSSEYVLQRLEHSDSGKNNSIRFDSQFDKTDACTLIVTHKLRLFFDSMRNWLFCEVLIHYWLSIAFNSHCI